MNRTLLLTFLVLFAGVVSIAASQLEDPTSELTAKAQAEQLVATAAKDDGRDDSELLQRVVDLKVGCVRLPSGVYRLTRSVVVDLDRLGYTSILGNGTAKVLMDGSGPAFKFVGTHFGSANPDGVEPNVWDRQRMPLVDGISIQGQHADSIGILAIGTMQLTITRTHIRGCLHAVQLLKNNRNLIVADCHFYENRGVGIFYDHVNLHQSNISSSHISYNAGGGVVSKGGNVRNIHITGCDIESNMSPDVEPTANVLIDCRDSGHGTAEVAITGCTIQHNRMSADSANIRVLGRSDRANEGHVTITGNVLSDVSVNVELQDCRGVVLTGNTFWQGYRHNLLVERCSNVVVGPNNFDRNPRYGDDETPPRNSLVFRDSRDCTLNGLHVNHVMSAPAGVLIEKCQRFNVSNCTVLDCDNVGLLLRDVRNSQVSGCLIRDDRENSNSEALRVSGGEHNLIINNLIN